MTTTVGTAALLDDALLNISVISNISIISINIFLHKLQGHRLGSKDLNQINSIIRSQVVYQGIPDVAPATVSRYLNHLSQLLMHSV